MYLHNLMCIGKKHPTTARCGLLLYTWKFVNTIWAWMGGSRRLCEFFERNNDTQLPAKYYGKWRVWHSFLFLGGDEFGEVSY